MNVPTRELLGRGSIYTLATILSMGSALLILPFLTRVLSLAEFGTVALATTFGQLVGLVANFALPAAITRAYFMDAGRREAAARLIFDGSLVAAATTITLALSSPFWWEPLMAADWSEAAVLSVVYGGLVSIVQLLLAFLRATERAWAFVFTASSSSVGGVLTGLTLCLLVNNSAAMYLAGLCGAQLLSVVGAVHWSEVAKFRGDPVEGYRRRALAVALPTVPHLLALQGMVVGLRAITQDFGGAEAVARFHIGYTVGSLGIVLLSALNNAWAPLVFKAAPAERVQVLAETTKVALWVGATASAVTALASPMLLSVMAPAEYGISDLVPVAVLVALSGPLYALYLAHMHEITASARTGGLALTTPLVTVVTLGAVALLASRPFGLLAAAAGVPVFYLGLSLAGKCLARGLGPLKLPYSQVLVATLLIALCGVAPILLPQSLSAYTALISIATVVLACCAWGLSRWLRSSKGTTHLQ